MAGSGRTALVSRPPSQAPPMPPTVHDRRHRRAAAPRAPICAAAAAQMSRLQQVGAGTPLAPGSVWAKAK